MTAAAQADLRSYARKRWPTLNHKGRISRLYDDLKGWSRRRVRSIYNNEKGVSLRAEEQAAIAELQRKARDEHRTLEQRIAALEARLIETDPDFYQPHLDAQRDAMGRSRS